MNACCQSACNHLLFKIAPAALTLTGFAALGYGYNQKEPSHTSITLGGLAVAVGAMFSAVILSKAVSKHLKSRSASPHSFTARWIRFCGKSGPALPRIGFLTFSLGTLSTIITNRAPENLPPLANNCILGLIGICLFPSAMLITRYTVDEVRGQNSPSHSQETSDDGSYLPPHRSYNTLDSSNSSFHEKDETLQDPP